MKTVYRALVSILLLTSTVAKAQLFVDNGPEGAIYLRGATGGALGASESSGINTALYVDGDITIEGSFNNQSTEVQLTGDFTNNGTLITSGDEVLRGGHTQILSGDLTGSNNFNNLILDKDASSWVSLASDTEISSSGTLIFEDGGILSTGVNYLLVKNPSVNALLGIGTNGSLDKFVMGELRRNVTAGNTYLLPVGGSDVDSDGGDGVQYAYIKPNVGSGIIAAAFHDDTGAGIAENIVICSGSIGNARDIDHKIGNGAWEITNPGGGILNYAVTLDPTDYTDLGYLDYTILKDGIPTGLDECDGVSNTLPITHDGLTSFSMFEVGASSDEALLPIELISFAAKVTPKHTVALDWQTLAEINNDYFTIERSLDGTAWEEVITQKGAGNSSSALNYWAEDHHPYLGISYYRLKQTDFDGGFTHLRTQSVNITKLLKSPLRLYPNPTKDSIAIEDSLEELNNIEVYDVFGRNCTYLVEITKDKETKILLDISELNIGVYLVKTATKAAKIYKR